MRTVRSLFAAPVRTQVVGEGRRGRGGGSQKQTSNQIRHNNNRDGVISIGDLLQMAIFFLFVSIV
jgi:hypothetical protein